MSTPTWASTDPRVVTAPSSLENALDELDVYGEGEEIAIDTTDPTSSNGVVFSVDDGLDENDNPKTQRVVALNRLVALLTGVVKDQQKRIEELEQKVNSTY